MEIDRIINRWFEETKKLLDGLPNRQSEVDGFCLGILHTVVIYLNASSILQEKDFNFPAMAILRIVSDLVIKFLWCLQGIKDNEIEIRIKRWEKKTFKEQRRLLSELKELFPSDAKETFEKTINEFDKRINNTLKEMPNTRQLFKDNKNLFLADVYALAYKQFNSAVHIDTDVVKKVLMSPLRKNGCDRDILLSTKDTNNIRIFRLSLLYMILIIMYKHYSWDTISIEKEYNQAVLYLK